MTEYAAAGSQPRRVNRPSRTWTGKRQNGLSWSTWVAQKGVRLGLSLAALEKLNGKTFTLMGFDKGGMAIVSDWNGGALGLLTDGCRIGVQLKPDPKATSAAVDAVPPDKEFASNDPAIRAAKPVVGEIIVAY